MAAEQERWSEIYGGAADVYMARFGLTPGHAPFSDRPGDVYVPTQLQSFVTEHGTDGLRVHIATRLGEVELETRERVDWLAQHEPTYRRAAEQRRLDFIGSLVVGSLQPPA